MKIFKMGVIGYGGMGSWHCENITKRITQIVISCIYDISSIRLAQAEQDGFKIFRTVEELLESDIDLVLIATPNNFHKYYSILSMRAGKHVVCEKPVCMTMQEFDEILSTKEETGMCFTAHQNRRWDVDFCVVKQILNQNIVGKPYYIDSRLFGSKGLPGDWRSSSIAGGGMLYDWSVHLIDQLIFLCGCNVKSVYAQLLKIKFNDVDDCNRIFIEFANGTCAQITVDTWCYIGESRWRISGDDGTAVVTEWGGRTGEIIKANIKKIDWEEGCIYTLNGRSRTMSPRPIEHLQALQIPILKKEPRWEEFYENFIDVMQNKERQLIDIEESKVVMRIIDACFESSKTGKTIYF